jgi:hypothetical protein
MLRIVLAAVVVSQLAPSPAGARQFVAKARDFRCLLDGKPVEGKSFYVFHRSKRKLRKALGIASRDVADARYPVGTILQLFPFEAMVKRGGRFNPSGNGWEFFQLEATADGTRIVARGGEEVANRFGSCQRCHAAAGRFDFVCEGHGAAALPLPPNVIRTLQQQDPRCQPR